jgi:antitoxin (DNA-binding transcriptional repressor) of toxin-antitoxin stability system
MLRNVDNHHEEYIIMRHNRKIARLVPYLPDKEYEETAERIASSLHSVREAQKPYTGSIKSLLGQGRKR